MPSRKYGENTDRDLGGRFASGNSGKPKGARHRTTQAIEKLLEGEAESLTRRAIEMALNGDIAALKLCLDRIAPVRRETYLSLNLPKLEGAKDIPKILSTLMDAAANGRITSGEAERMCRLLEIYAKSKEVFEFEIRLNGIEQTIKEFKK